jgi:predicted transcriptional regulator
MEQNSMSDSIENKLNSTRSSKLAPELNSGPEIRTLKTQADEAKPAPTKHSKSRLVLQMLQRPEGTTITQIAIATGWQSHTTRAALTRLREKGHGISSEKAEGKERVYKVAAR